MFVFYIRKRILIYVLSIIAALLILLFAFKLVFGTNEVPAVSPIYIGNTGVKAIAFMVNVDWGEKIVPDMIEVLKEKEVRATFFVTGRFAKKHPETIQMIAAAGHEIGNHGFSHPHADKISLEDNKKEILETQQVMADLRIEISKIFAPPYGEHKPHVLEAAEALGYKTIMWTVDTIDWQDPSPDEIINRVLSKADNGALILMHPKECTVAALPLLIEKLVEQGFSFNTVTEIIQ